MIKQLLGWIGTTLLIFAGPAGWFWLWMKDTAEKDYKELKTVHVAPPDDL